MDHEEMRAAYLRALNYVKKTDYTDFCNDCRNDYLADTGGFVHVKTILTGDAENKTYKLWYCADCSAKFDNEFIQENFSFS